MPIMEGKGSLQPHAEPGRVQRERLHLHHPECNIQMDQAMHAKLRTLKTHIALKQQWSVAERVTILNDVPDSGRVGIIAQQIHDAY